MFVLLNDVELVADFSKKKFESKKLGNRMLLKVLILFYASKFSAIAYKNNVLKFRSGKNYFFRQP
jgi:hypothetical protein